MSETADVRMDVVMEPPWPGEWTPPWPVAAFAPGAVAIDPEHGARLAERFEAAFVAP